MFSPQRNPGLYLDTVTGKGLGLFCSASIKANDLIESCIAIPFDATQSALIDQTYLYDYYFSLTFLSDEQAEQLDITNKNKAGCIALGILSMANHAEQPNAHVVKTVQGKAIIMTLQAIMDIPADQEISISYGKLWFTPR